MNSIHRGLWPILSALLAAALLAGCVGTTPSTRYYALDTTIISSNIREGTIISVGPFRIPEYLNRPQIVLRGQGANLKVLKFDRWAEPLADSFSRRLYAQLSQQTAKATFVEFSSLAKLDTDYRIIGSVNVFEADASGTVTLQFYWAMQSKESEFKIAPHIVTFSKTVTPEDVPAITNAMGELIDELAASMAAEMTLAGIE
jgi:uncharacterized lipoprotein YmbA